MTDKIVTTLQDRNGLAYAPNEATPFTGILEHKFPNGQKQAEGNFKDGQQNGLATFWFESGQKKAEINFKDGQQYGLKIR
jgi:antitoxin component YwqK of YwqJK toxin-antitoxin module